jgi:MFS family permease
MTRRHLLIHWAFAFVSTLSDEAFPLFAMSVAGGLGMPEATIGSILSLAGLVFASFQYVVYHVVVDRCGIYNALVVGSILGIQPLFLIPISLLMPSRVAASIFLAVIMGVCKVFVSLYFTTISLPLNKSVPPSQRATMNGFQLMGGSLARACGPIVAGNLAGFCFSSPNLAHNGSIIVYSTIALVGWLVTSYVWTVMQYAEAALLVDADSMR